MNYAIIDCSINSLLKKMKKTLLITLFFMMIPVTKVLSQESNDTTAYLLTCGPGTEVYSIYGHSALRIVIHSQHSDSVYNWGVFDFATKNFAWKFAKGRLDYMLIAETPKSFLGEYFYEKRYVYSQKLNLNEKELSKLTELINENIKPENAKYRYDFFYDDCSTRIRDLLEKSIGDKLKYPPAEPGKNPTFRDMVAKYQNPYPWLRFGVDLIMGSSADKQTGFRERMFLPIDLKDELSKTFVFRSGKMIPLLQNPEVLMDYKAPDTKPYFIFGPTFTAGLIIIIVLILAALTKSRKITRIIDIVIFSTFSILSVLMIFFNFFTDHAQMKVNLNIIWLNPFILGCLVSLILNKAGVIWFKTVFYITAGFLVLQYVLPQDFNIAFSFMAIILLIRSSVRCGFSWNPLNLPTASI
jgi:hypothetical protein